MRSEEQLVMNSETMLYNKARFSLTSQSDNIYTNKLELTPLVREAQTCV